METPVLVDPRTITEYEAFYAAGSDKQYPSLDLVRIERRLFGGPPAVVLDYAFGCGENLFHLLARGYTVEGIDAAVGAKRLVERKLRVHPEYAPRVRLMTLAPDAQRLPYPDAAFDGILCMSVLTLLGSHERVHHLLSELCRVCKPGGRILVDINGPRSPFAQHATPVGNDCYETRSSAPGGSPYRSLCPASPEAFTDIVRQHFAVDDVGFTAHRYLSTEAEEFIICAHRA